MSASQLNEGGKPEPVILPPGDGFLEIKEINLDIQSQVCHSEKALPQIDIEVAPISDRGGSEKMADDLAISEKFSDDGFIYKEIECIDYDEALHRVGGFGVYQSIIFMAFSIFSVYGDQFIYNFIYLTNPHKEECSKDGVTWVECTREDVCTPNDLLRRPNVGHKDYIYALTADMEEMNCWSSSSIAFMCQLWFIGFFAKVVFTPLFEKYGHQKIMKWAIIPGNILSFNLMYLSRSYNLRCLGFLLTGIVRVKMNPCMLILRETVQTKHSSIALTFFWMFVFTIIMVFCFYIEYVSKNAIYYLHFVNGISILCSVIIYAISVDRPLSAIRNGNEEEGKKSLNFISRFNAVFSRQEPYQFDESVKIVASKTEVMSYKMQEKLGRLYVAQKINMVDKDGKALSLFKSSAQSTIKSDKSRTLSMFSSNQKSDKVLIKSTSSIQLIKDIGRNYKMMFLAFCTVKIFLEVTWYLNVYTIQKFQSADSSIFHNGMILGILSYVAFTSCGFFTKFFDPYNSQMLQSCICFAIALYKILQVLFREKMNESQYLVSEKVSLYGSFLFQCCIEYMFNTYLQSITSLFPSKYLFITMEMQVSIGACISQVVPQIILKPDPVPQVVFIMLSLAATISLAYILFLAKNKKEQEEKALKEIEMSSNKKLQTQTEPEQV